MFTAYMQELYPSKLAANLDASVENKVVDSWYPTIFFYDLTKNRVVWEIFGAEVFIEIDMFKKVKVLTNEIWIELNKEQYNQKESEEM